MSKTALIVLVAAVLLLLAIAIPNFVPARVTAAQNACVNNLEIIQLAKEKWAETYHKLPTDTPAELDLFNETNSARFSAGTRYSAYVFSQVPECPARGTYIIGAVNEEPRCSTGYPEHSLRR